MTDKTLAPAPNESVFARVLEKFFDGKRDERTLRIVGKGRVES